MMKRILTSIIALAAIFAVSAQKDYGSGKDARSMILEKKDGTTLQVNINDGLTITFEEGYAIISAANDNGEPIAVKTPFDEIRSYTFSNYKSGEKPSDPVKPDDPWVKPGSGKDARSIILEKRDGTTVQVNINQGLTMTFADGNAIISGVNDKDEPVSVVTPFNEIRSYTFSSAKGPELSGVETIAKDNTTAPVLDGMTLQGLAPGTRIAIVDTAGRTVATIVAEADGTAALPFDTLPRGIYIISTPSGALKLAL